MATGVVSLEALASGRPAGDGGVGAPSVVPFVARLAEHGSRPALIGGDGTVVTYAELARRAADVAARLGPTRRLVAVSGGNDVRALVAYLGALAGGHAVLLGPPGEGSAAELVRAYRPDVVALAEDGWCLDERHRGTGHDLHPDLALLLTTSGSTGSPKLVRLSHRNLEANAEAIGEYLRLTPEDRAITSLPVHYCYGLSVVHSHLAVGAALSLTELSVTDPCFWAQARRDGVTGVAGVPYTFELLERIGFDGRQLPSLRYLTQAGGRMPGDRVRQVAALGRRRGFELFVMYGQTEATARMAYLPPARALDHPQAIGVPIPGGELHVDAPPGSEVGELVYRGPNVMLGYARGPEDLALGRVVHELRTGDIGRRGADGLLEIVGRSSRFLKLFGLRVDLDRAEALLRDAGVDAVCTGDDEAVVVAVAGPGSAHDATVARQVLVERLGLPRSAVVVHALEDIPRLGTGKPDHAALRALPRATGPDGAPGAPGAPTATTGQSRPAEADPPSDPGTPVVGVRQAFAEVLDLPPERVGDSDTFVGLGGDSLSYVEVSVLLEAALDDVPTAWHLMTVGELERRAVRHQASSGPSRPGRAMETNVVLRGVATALIVATHAGVFMLQGGAHVLLAVAGFNFARFRLPPTERAGHLRQAAVSVARIAVPTALWLAFQFTYAEPLEWPRALFVNNYLGTGLWEYWYLEALLQLLVVLGVVFAVPSVRAFERRRPFAVAFGALVVATALRYDALDIGHPAHWMYMPDTVLWCFALGWAAQRARTVPQRLAVTAVGAACVWGFFDRPGREVMVAVGLLSLVWVARVRVPAGVHRVVAALAGASLYVYLVQWAVLPPLRGVVPGWAAASAAVLAGMATWWAAGRAEARLVAVWRQRRPPLTSEPATPARPPEPTAFAGKDPAGVDVVTGG